MPFPFHFSLSLISFSLSFCIFLAGRCYQCCYCQAWKSRGAHETPWQWAHASTPLWASCVVCVCVYRGGISVIRPLCVWEAPLFPSHIHLLDFLWHKWLPSTSFKFATGQTAFQKNKTQLRGNVALHWFNQRLHINFFLETTLNSELNRLLMQRVLRNIYLYFRAWSSACRRHFSCLLRSSLRRNKECPVGSFHADRCE